MVESNVIAILEQESKMPKFCNAFLVLVLADILKLMSICVSVLDFISEYALITAYNCIHIYIYNLSSFVSKP